LRRLLKDIEDRYSYAFEDLGPGALQDLKSLIDCVDGFLDLLADPRRDFRVKLADYAKVGMMSSSSAGSMPSFLVIC